MARGKKGHGLVGGKRGKGGNTKKREIVWAAKEISQEYSNGAPVDHGVTRGGKRQHRERGNLMPRATDIERPGGGTTRRWQP